MFELDKTIASHHEEVPLILIAEDDPSQRLLLKTVLEKEGYKLLEAQNGIEALSMFRQQKPGMVLLDAVMPEMDGFEACRQIRELEEGGDVLILMLTALHDEYSVRHSFEVGADDFITKPIFWSVLTGRVKYLLRAKITEKHHKKAEEQFMHTQKLEVVGNLTEGISHHFNNLLVTILGYTEMLLNGYARDDEEKQTRYLQAVYTASKQASELIAQMQAFSGGGKSVAKPLKLKLLLEEVMGMLSPTLPSSIELHLTLADNLPLVKIDPVQFNQVMMNMIINARDAMENSGNLYIELKQLTVNNTECVSCHQSFKGDFLELVIKDTGQGIDKAKIKRIFEPYYTTRSIGQGSGMGLSVVHGIMHNHDGHILVNVEPGRSTEFKLLFPVVDAEQLPSEEAIGEVEISSEKISGARILLVDDEVAVGNFESEYLEIQGYQVTYFMDPSEAIIAISKNPEAYDLVITDKIMPHIDGLELAGAITAIRPDLPVILCTGNRSALPDINLECVGIRALLGKPIEGSALLRAVENVLVKSKNDKVQ